MLKTRVDNAALVRLLWSMPSGGIMVNVLGAQIPAGTQVTQTLATALGTALKAGTPYTNFKSHISTGVALAAVGVRDIRNVDLPEFLDTGAPVFGTAADDVLARGVALVVTLRTGKAGRGFRGRVYLGGFTEAGEDADGTASTTVVADSLGFITGVSSVMSAQGLTLAVVGKNRNAVTLTRDVTNPDGSHSTKVTTHAASVGHVEPVTAIQVRNDIWDSQRRRTAPGSVSTLFGPLASVTLA